MPRFRWGTESFTCVQQVPWFQAEFQITISWGQNNSTNSKPQIPSTTKRWNPGYWTPLQPWGRNWHVDRQVNEVWACPILRDEWIWLLSRRQQNMPLVHGELGGWDTIDKCIYHRFTWSLCTLNAHSSEGVINYVSLTRVYISFIPKWSEHHS